MSTDWAITTRVLFGPAAAAELWPQHAQHTESVLTAREMMRHRARSFWLASKFLSGAVRDDLALLYAFCRQADDAGDDTPDPISAARELDRLRDQLLGLAPATPFMAAFRAAVARRRIPLGSATALIEGVRSDVGPVRIADDGELLRYCYRVAGTVGLMMCGVLGARRSGQAHAVDLGIAMQLTNIVRDIAEDAARDRLYLPATRLRAEGIDPDDVIRGTAAPLGLERVLHGLLDLADQYYRSGEAGARYLPPGHRPAVLVASRLYGAIGRRARRRRPRADALPARVVVPRGAKTWQVAVGMGLACLPRMRRSPREQEHDPALHAAFRGWPGTRPHEGQP